MKFGFVSEEYFMAEVTSKEMEIVTRKLWIQMHLDKVLLSPLLRGLTHYTMKFSVTWVKTQKAKIRLANLSAHIL